MGPLTGIKIIELAGIGPGPDVLKHDSVPLLQMGRA